MTWDLLAAVAFAVFGVLTFGVACWAEDVQREVHNVRADLGDARQRLAYAGGLAWDVRRQADQLRQAADDVVRDLDALVEAGDLVNVPSSVDRLRSLTGR